MIIRAESTTGPRGPFTWKQQIFNTFHHNPTAIWSPADQKFLLYFIGKNVTTPTTCTAQSFPNLISVTSSHDLKTWDEPKLLITNKTNTAPWLLWSQENQTSAMLLGIESNNLYYAQNYSAPYKIA
jgi:hypothetical protein